MISKSRLSFAAILATIVALVGCHPARPTDDARHNEGDAANANGGRLLPTSSAGGAAAQAAGDGRGSVVATQDARRPVTSIAPASRDIAVNANNVFAVDLFARIAAAERGKNLLVSPLSAFLSLTMAYVGARAETRTELGRALHLGENADQTILDGQNALSQALRTRGPNALSFANQRSFNSDGGAPASEYELQIVNSLWAEASYPWQAQFLKTLASDYGASLHQQNFREQYEPARHAINEWVSTQTSDKIQNLLPPRALDASTRLVLVNALHLKFPWATPFRERETAAAPFTRVDRSRVSPQFMHQTARFAYVDDGQAQIVALPLAGRELSLLIALPHPGVSLAGYESSLRAGSAALAQPTQSALVALSLPKVAFTAATFSLTDALRSMGAQRAFQPDAADFEGMCSAPPDHEKLYLSAVLQKTMIALQENGVEAAAATAALMVATASLSRGPAPVPIAMDVDHPYLVAVVDVPTSSVLLLGQITDPTDPGSG